MSEIALIGIGMGNPGGLTCEAADFLKKADLLIGAPRMVQAVRREGQESIEEYLPEKVAKAVKGHPACARIAVLMSGDVGFYSGAKKLLPLLPEGTAILPGISSVGYFCAKLGTAWDDVKLTSMHGTSCNLIGEVCRHQKVFSLLGRADDAARICQKLLYYNLPDVTVSIGENLGYPEEKILTGPPAAFAQYESTPLSVILIRNPEAAPVNVPGIPDNAFIRGNVPMTKEEVRTISISRLALSEHSVVYDVGAGTGSVSIEAALLATEGRVFSIEKNPEAIGLLRENKRKFRADNMEIIEGRAPEALADLPAPTHAFIGGSTGSLREIVQTILEKNPHARFVVNAVTLETLHEAMDVFTESGFSDPDIICISASRAKKAGRYHLMTAMNPVYIMTAGSNPG